MGEPGDVLSGGVGPDSEPRARAVTVMVVTRMSPHMFVFVHSLQHNIHNPIHSVR